MRYLALATDYDGTIASHGRVSEETVEALKGVAESGRKLILVTGRELPDLLQVFPQADMFERIVAENGALMYRPDRKEEEFAGGGPAAGVRHATAARNPGRRRRPCDRRHG